MPVIRRVVLPIRPTMPARVVASYDSSPSKSTQLAIAPSGVLRS